MASSLRRNVALIVHVVRRLAPSQARSHRPRDDRDEHHERDQRFQQ